MKRIIVFLLALVMLTLALVSCGAVHETHETTEIVTTMDVEQLLSGMKVGSDLIRDITWVINRVYALLTFSM